MEIKAVGYFVFESPRWDLWLKFASELVRAQVELQPEDDWARLRLDRKVQRILLQQAPEVDFAVGLETADEAALDHLAARLEQQGLEITHGPSDEAERRGVARFIAFRDPDGNRLEAYVGLADAATPFAPTQPIGGFRTGELGIGHIVLATPQPQAMGAFYRNVLGFLMSDFCREPFVAEFFHINPRHHSVAVIQSSEAGIHHVMLEYLEWDDVGRAYDVVLQTPEIIGQTLGRHTNDQVTSFYTYSPDRFMFELGWAGRLIGENWQVEELKGPSLWGHERRWLSPEKKVLASEILKTLATQGIRAPVSAPRPDEFESRR